jgi:HK97 family phage portal protein
VIVQLIALGKTKTTAYQIMFNFFRKQKEERALPNQVGGVDIVELFSGGLFANHAGVDVTVKSALGVPAVFCAVNFISALMASLPLHVYRRTNGAPVRDKTNSLGNILQYAVNDECTSFDWRKYMMQGVLTGGRSFTVIRRNTAGRIIELTPLDPLKVSVKRVNGRKKYVYQDENQQLSYDSVEIIDIPFMLGADGVGHLSPIITNSKSIALAIAATDYGSKFFENGGVPPFAITGNFPSGAAMSKASKDLHNAIKLAAKENRQAVVLPPGYQINSIGTDAEKMQLLELKRHSVEEIARIYNLPPVFLQDLTTGTFNNVEQQDLNLVKHTVSRWAIQIEQELNLKLFGRLSNKTYVKFNLDGLLRGDFKARMEGFARGIQTGQITPNEARSKEDREPLEGGDDLLIQGATVPLKNQGTPADKPSEPNEGETDD